MGRIAFVFSGQGDQYPGMGKELAEQYPAADQIFEMCDSLRPGTSQQCFSGTVDELKETKNTHPCLFAMELAAQAVLKDNGIEPDMVAGFSLGEVVAATVAGLMSYETGFETVCKRGELMQQAAEKTETAMAAVLKLEEEQVSAICDQQEQIYPVNFNCPGQITVAGLKENMSAFTAAVKEAGGRALPLKVKGAFHSPFMDEAAKTFAEYLKDIEFVNGSVTLYSNLTGGKYPEDIKSTLSAQINNPVRWETVIRNMIADGADTFIEIGPGITLTGMINKIDRNVRTYSVTDIPKILAEVK